MNIFKIKTYLQDLQNSICLALTKQDGTPFQTDTWEYTQGQGGGETRILNNGPVIERGGVNFSHIHGQQLPHASTQRHPALSQSPFQALGLSLVIHPLNPYVPTVHTNLRFILAEPAWWFGGGFDLTPYYGFVEDCEHWHRNAKKACEPFGEAIYPRYKKCCDDYFYLNHRQEPRGVGGLFFDDLNANSFSDFEQCFAFVRSVGDHFLTGYLPILTKRKNTAYGKHEQDFQHYRRGRYVEFNLLYDRGTSFGLQSGGRTESILMSMPPRVRWEYNWQPKAGSAEAELYEKFLIQKDWV